MCRSSLKWNFAMFELDMWEMGVKRRVKYGDMGSMQGVSSRLMKVSRIRNSRKIFTKSI